MLIRIILAVDSPALAGRFRQILEQPDCHLETIKPGESLWEAVSRGSFDLIVIAQAILGVPASETVHSLTTLPESPDVVVLCDEEDPHQRGALLAGGCLAVLYTGLSNKMLEEAMTAAIQRRLQAVEETLTPATEAALGPQLSDFESGNPAMQAFMDVVRRVVASDTTLLVTGETGVGKERLARAIHGESPRSAGPFIAVNCAALPETLLESELFGHEEGAFTGASRARRGWFELAHNGTLFLDEIGEMPRHLQVKLLTVLQTREVQRVGSEIALPIDVRIMAATNRDLTLEVDDGNFRRDLYYRLSVVTLTIPPLRERRGDIPRLVEDLITHFGRQIPQQIRGIEPRAIDAFCRYDWPGNVRELMNVVERAMLLAGSDLIGLEDLPEGISRLCPEHPPQFPTPAAVADEQLRLPVGWLQQPLREARERLLLEFERAYLVGLLEATRGRVGETARRAGIRPRSLYEKMKRLGLRKEDFRNSR